VLSDGVLIIFMHNVSIDIEKLHLVFEEELVLLSSRCTFNLIFWLAWQEIDSYELKNWREEVSSKLQVLAFRVLEAQKIWLKVSLQFFSIPDVS
jgi:hypothetical protein